MPDFGLLVPGVQGHAQELTDDVALLRALLDVEVAWVKAQAHLGLVTADSANQVGEAASALVASPARAAQLAGQIAAEASGGGNPVIPLIAHLRAAASQLAGDESLRSVIHTGLTSQDVHDTALVLLLRAAADAALASLDVALEAVARLARDHRDTPALARTLAQAAVPTSLGARFASWLAGLSSARQALIQARDGLPLSYGGAGGELAGTMKVLAGSPVSGSAVDGPLAAGSLTTGAAAARATAAGPKQAGSRPAGDPFILVDAWAAQLGLPVTPSPWHQDRSPFMAMASACAQLCAALGHVAGDVLAAVRPGIDELREPAAPGRGVSSAMAHKQNPVLSIMLKRTAIAAPPLLAQVYTAAGLAVDERSDGAWHCEWPALQQLARYALAAADTGTELLTGLQVNVDAVVGHLASALPEFALPECAAAAGAGAGADLDTNTGLAADTCQGGGTLAGKDSLGAAPLLVDRALASVAGRHTG